MQEKQNRTRAWLVGMLLAFFSGISFSLAASLLIDVLQLPDLSFFPNFNTSIDTGTPSGIFQEILLNLLLAPFAEELLFRKLLYNKCRERLSILPSVLIVSLLFAVFHMNLRSFVYALLFSFLLCMIVERSCNFYFAVMAHFSANLLALLLTVFAGADSFVMNRTALFLIIGACLLITTILLWRGFDHKGVFVWKRF